MVFFVLYAVLEGLEFLEKGFPKISNKQNVKKESNIQGASDLVTV